MRPLHLLAAVSTLGAVSVGLLATGAVSAGATTGYSATLTGGQTTVVVAPATADALVSNGILPLPVRPGVEHPVFSHGLTLSASFPVTGGAVDLGSGTGTIDHSGGLDFYDLRTRASLVIEDFDIDLGTGTLTAYVPAVGARVPVFDLSLTHAQVSTDRRLIDVRDIAVTLDPVAAGALDSTFGTSLFTGGLPIGTASSVLIQAF